MTNEQKQWILSSAEQAAEAKHIWPNMAACEAALESNYGQSKLAVLGNNLFGMKHHGTFDALSLPTKEFLNGAWTDTMAAWTKYPSVRESFMDRMATLYRLRTVYPHYDAALNAADGETYIREVSQTWSTDPQRADKVLAIYGEAFPQAVGAMGLEDEA